MGLFSKDEAKEMQQTQEIKEAAVSQPPQLNLNQTNSNDVNNLEMPPKLENNVENQNFVNPFSQKQGENNMEKYVIIETIQNGTPEESTIIDSPYYDTFQEAHDELHRRFVSAKRSGFKGHFCQSVSTRNI